MVETLHLMHQGSRIIIAVVQVRAVKIYVAAPEALKKNERLDETQCTTKIDDDAVFSLLYG